MVHFPIIRTNFDMITKPTVSSTDGHSHLASSLKGRMICLVHTLATPLKAWAGLGKLFASILGAVTMTVDVLTLNAPPRYLLQAGASVIDIAAGSILLPIALVANLIRGIAGTILHPGALIRDDSSIKNQYGFNSFAANYNVLQGTLVHYPI